MPAQVASVIAGRGPVCPAEQPSVTYPWDELQQSVATVS